MVDNNYALISKSKGENDEQIRQLFYLHPVNPIFSQSPVLDVSA